MEICLGKHWVSLFSGLLHQQSPTINKNVVTMRNLNPTDIKGEAYLVTLYLRQPT